MDQKEAIKKLEVYIKALKEIDQTKENIREMKRRIDMTPVAPVRKYMLGRFLWPFLVGATIVLLVLCSVGDAIFATNPDSDMEMLFIPYRRRGRRKPCLCVLKVRSRFRDGLLVRHDTVHQARGWT